MSDKADVHSQLLALISSCIDEGDYDPAEDYIKDPFCRRTMHTASLAINEIDTLRARVAELEAAAAHLANGWTAQHVVDTDLDGRVVNMIMVWDRPRFEAAIAESARDANGEVPHD